jgi:hypothetical protein
MIQKALALGVALTVLLSACAPKSAATTSPVDVQHTAEAAAFTMVAQTQESIPTNTSIPPTDTPVPTSVPTLTPIASPTLESLLTTPGLPTTTGLTPNAPPTKFPATSVSSSSGNDNCNKPLTAWQGPTVTLTIINETKPQGKIILSLYVVTDQGECGYLTDLSRGPVGQYSAGAFVEGKKDFKVFGGFRIGEGEWKITVRNDKIIALGSCYPGC